GPVLAHPVASKIPILLIRLGLKHFDSGLAIMGFEDAESPYSRSRNEIMYRNRGGFRRPLGRSVRRAFHPSKHLLEVLFERASRCYELRVLTHDVLVESFEQWDALGS